MHYPNRKKTALWSAVMAVGIGGFAMHAMGQTNYTLNATGDSEVETSGPYGSGFGYNEIYGPSGTYPSFAVYDYTTGGGTIPNPAVTSVSPNFTVDLYDEGYSGEAQTPATLNFYLATDTTTNVTDSGTPASPLLYEPTGTVGNGLATPGSTGSFAAGSSLFFLGSGTYTPGAAGALNAFNLSLNNAGAGNVSAAETYLTDQTQAGGKLRIVVTSNSTSTGYLSTLGYGSANPPQLTLGVSSTPITPNNSSIYLTSPPAGAGNTPNNISINLGRIVISYGATQSFTVGNTSSTGSALILTDPNGLSGSYAPPTGNPVPALGTSTLTAGFSGADTNGYAPGSTITGSVVFTDANNTASTITVNASAYGVDQRKISSGNTGFNTTAANNVGRILVGSTGNVGVTLSTTNALAIGSDYGPDELTTETLAAGAQSSAYAVDDPFTKNPVGTISASAPSAFTFNSQATDANVVGSVSVVTSGVYGDAHSTTVNGQVEHYNGNYTSFTDTAGLTGEGIPGEDDFADVYLQWTGYQPAAVTSSPSPVVVAPNSTSTVTLTNAASNDNIISVTANSVTDTQSQGLRAAAFITGHGAFNQTWTAGGWNLVSGLTTGTEINGSAQAGDTNSYSTTGTIGFTQSAQMINGTYGAVLPVGLQNDQTIQGATPNDLGNVNVAVQATVTSNPSVQTGAYTLNGGTLSAPATNLTGSFAQSGGQSTFANITGSGQLTITGGSSTLAVGGGASSLSSLIISGTGSLNITNNHVIIGYTGSPANADSTIRGYLLSGRNAGAWNGATGIVSSGSSGTGVATGYSIGYADGADHIVTGLSSGQIEVKYTLLGDANLDGLVTGDDFTILVGNLGKAVAGWDKGDFLYTGLVTGDDFTALVGNLGKSASGADVVIPAADYAAIDAFAAANGLTMPSVPEPASAGLLLVAGAGMLARRRRSM